MTPKDVIAIQPPVPNVRRRQAPRLRGQLLQLDQERLAHLVIRRTRVWKRDPSRTSNLAQTRMFGNPEEQLGDILVIHFSCVH